MLTFIARSSCWSQALAALDADKGAAGEPLSFLNPSARSGGGAGDLLERPSVAAGMAAANDDDDGEEGEGDDAVDMGSDGILRVGKRAADAAAAAADEPMGAAPVER
ncbi:hypothetical protein T492DRAFT_891911 [Pavlovales sp. CCMP2436]|nr:hypothetical protein T492DRAFT_891911 [Pavlovales sp. CCMP2436]